MPKTNQEDGKDQKKSQTIVSSDSSNIAGLPGLRKKKIDMRFVWMGIATAVGFVSFFIYVVYVGEVAPRIFAGSTARASLSKSLIFAYPLTISSGEKSSVSAFVVSEDGDPIGNKTVIISSNLGTVLPTTAKTDEDGNAKFEFYSNTPGIAELAIVTDDMRLPQTVTIEVKGE